MNRLSTPFTYRTASRILTALLLAATGGESGLAQELPWLPKGTVSLDFAPSFWTWDHRYGVGPTGATQVLPLGADLTANPLGSGVLPDLTELEAALAAAMEDPDYRIRLGASRAYVDQARLVFPFRLEIGLTDWLTVGGMVPLVRPRTEITFALDADSLNADAGLSPQLTDAASVSLFLASFQAALNEAQGVDPSHPDLVAAQEFLAALVDAYGNRTFFPVAGSASGLRLQERMAAIRESLAAIGVTGLPETLPLASGYLEEEDFQAFLAGPVMRAAPLEDWTTLWSLGDIELTAAARLLHRGFVADSAGVLPFLRYQLGVAALLRLGTGAQDDGNRFLDQSAGDGQTDVEGSLFGFLEAGSRFGLWGRIRYGIQMKGEAIQRIARPSEALPARARLALLDWTPGNYLEFDLNPRFYLTPALSLGLRYRHWRKGSDTFRLQPLDPEVADRVHYPPADLLAQETEQSLREIAFTATFSTLPGQLRGEASLPVHLRVSYFRPIGGSGGRTPKGGRVEAGITLYRSFWGTSEKGKAGVRDQAGS